jgi:hypothetical protein
VIRIFDPTAFENMKVVIEGYLYDKDLDGDLKIVDRNDLVNLAKLSREYSIQFQLRDSNRKQLAIFRLISGLENLSAELLLGSFKQSKQGCHVQISFHLIHPNEVTIYDVLQQELQQIWGEMRTIKQQVCIEPLQRNHLVQNKILIDFNRLILEDQIDDLVNIADHTIETLYWLDKLNY